MKIKTMAALTAFAAFNVATAVDEVNNDPHPMAFRIADTAGNLFGDNAAGDATRCVVGATTFVIGGLGEAVGSVAKDAIVMGHSMRTHSL